MSTVPAQLTTGPDDDPAVFPRTLTYVGAPPQVRELPPAAPLRTRVARVLGVHVEERVWTPSADGERIVGEELDRLGPAWVVLHDVAVGPDHPRLDHLVLGPGGVFAVDSHFHWGRRVWATGETVVVGGSRQPYVRSSRTQAERVGRLLGAATGRAVPITGVVAIVCDDRTVKSQPRDGAVLVLGPRAARQAVLDRAVALDVTTVQRLAMAARRTATWTER